MAVCTMLRLHPCPRLQPPYRAARGLGDSRMATRPASPSGTLDAATSSTSAPTGWTLWGPSSLPHYRGRQPSVQCRSSGGDSPSTETGSSKASGSGRANSGGGDRVFTDTRIHWGDSEEGWLGVDSGPDSLPSGSSASTNSSSGRKSESGVSEALRDVLSQAKDSHYRYLRIPTNADLEEIKAAYRKLSKEYHPDTTSLPLEVAAQKFVKLKEAYTVLSNEADRRYYDWTLAQKMVSKERLAGERSWSQNEQGPRPKRAQRYVEPVDALAPGENLPLSEQAQTALAFDLFAALVSIAAIIFASVFKNQQ